MRTTPPFEQYLAQRVVITGCCWYWTGKHDYKGYGKAHLGKGKFESAHRWIYRQLVADIPDGLVIDHICRTRDCVNPDHLEPVSTGDNTRRGWSFSAVNARKEQCPNGHEYNDMNTRVYRGYRYCKACDSMAVPCPECEKQITRSNLSRHRKTQHRP